MADEIGSVEWFSKSLAAADRLASGNRQLAPQSWAQAQAIAAALQADALNRIALQLDGVITELQRIVDRLGTIAEGV